MDKSKSLINAYRVNGTEHQGMRLSIINPHYHNFYELYFFYGDGMRYFLENRIYCLKKHDVIAVDMLTYHRTNYSVTKNADRINVSFSPDILDHVQDDEIRASAKEFFRRVKYIDGCSYDNEYVERSLQQLISLCETDTSDRTADMRKTLILLDIVFLLMNTGEPAAGKGRTPDSGVSDTDRFSDIIAYINASFCKDISLSIIAGKYSMSRYYLCRKFRKITGAGITEFINSRRLSEAEKLLKNTGYSITKICELTGFNSLSYFSRIFKKTYAEAPCVFRKH